LSRAAAAAAIAATAAWALAGGRQLNGGHGRGLHSYRRHKVRVGSGCQRAWLWWARLLRLLLLLITAALGRAVCTVDGTQVTADSGTTQMPGG
jgi:hypothetical protein